MAGGGIGRRQLVPVPVGITLPASFVLRIDPERGARSLLAFALLLILALLLADYWLNYREMLSSRSLQRFFNTAREDSLPSFLGLVQSVLMAATAWLLWWLARDGQLEAGAVADRPRAWLWIAVFLSYLALDDGAQIHERFGTAIDDFSSSDSWTGALLSRFPSYAWQVTFAPLLGGAFLLLLVFLWRRVPEARALLLLVPVLLATAVGLDFVEGLADDSPWNLYALAAERYDLDAYTLEVFHATGFQTLQHFSRSVEEMIELLANSVLWAVLLRAFSTQPVR